MPSAPFIPAQQPDGSVGRRYSKAFKYVFALLRTGEDLSNVPNDGPQASSSLVDEGRFVVLTLPQQIQFREPYATVVTVMQDGGKVVESRGQVIRPATISGTTGFLPPSTAVGLQPTMGKLVPNVTDLDGQLGAISGYLAFRKLRYLFQQYGDRRRLGDLDVTLYYFDYKNDDFWRVEPESFDWVRSNRRPMSYDYNVSFKCLELADPVVTRDQQAATILGIPGFTAPSARVSTDNVGGVVSKVAGGVSSASKSSILSAVARFSDMVESGLGFLKFCDVVVQRAFQATLNKLDAVVGLFAAVHDTFFTLLDTVPTLLAQLSSSLAGLFRTIDEFAPDNIAQEINAWALEVTTLSDHMAVQVGLTVASQSQRDVKDTDQRFSQGRMKHGAATDLMQEPAAAAGSPDANPFIGSSGLALVTDVDGLASTSQYIAVVINNGEDIYALARRTLGKIERFIDLVLINKLEFPFIVDPGVSRPPNTLAWGDRVLVPAPTGTRASVIAPGSGSDTIPSASGVVDTVSLPSELIDSQAMWSTDQWIGYSVTAVTGGFRQTLVCNSNTQTKLVLGGTWTITITPGTTTYSVAYAKFDPGRPATAETRAYGVDMLAVFASDGRCDAVLGATGDLAVARGLDNLFQAITLRSRCPLGEHPFHKGYGIATPVGRPFTGDVSVVYSFMFRRSLLADPRISKVRNVQFNESGDTVTASAEIQPVDARAAQPITVKVGA